MNLVVTPPRRVQAGEEVHITVEQGTPPCQITILIDGTVIEEEWTELMLWIPGPEHAGKVVTITAEDSGGEYRTTEIRVRP